MSPIVGRLSAANVSIRQFVEVAYALPSFRVEGGPGWINADRFTIEATVSARTVIVQARGMPEVLRRMTPDPTTDAGPSLFTAVQEQLGLKLEATKAPVDVLVVDRLEKPSAD